MSAAQIDEWLPHFQVRARYSIVVRAPVSKTYAALASAKFSNLTTVRSLMRLRGYRLEGGQIATPGLAESSSRYGSFLQLAAIPEQEVLVGIAGRFWRPDGGIVHGLSPATFRDFQQDGYAKAVWNFLIAPANGSTCLSTETRVQTFGRSATFKFRLYWAAVGPFSGLMRKAMLREVKRIAEQTAA